MVYGNASQPNSAHVGDQLPLYAKNQLRPLGDLVKRSSPI